MHRSLLSLLAVVAFALTLTACESSPTTYPVVLNFWRPISNPTLLMQPQLAQSKLDYDLAQCKCSNYPINVPHQQLPLIAPDLGRLAETSAIKVDGPYDSCVTSPGAVLMECMRARGWEPTSCSGRMQTAGGTACALTVMPAINYPDDYPYRGPRDTSWDGAASSPAEQRQNYP